MATPNKKILVLFDVDGTLTPARAEASEEMKEFLAKLGTKTSVGIVGGSDLVKQQEQMGANIVKEVDYSFSENGLVAYKNGELIGKEVLYCLDFVVP
jgi:phosphomannomutase